MTNRTRCAIFILAALGVTPLTSQTTQAQNCTDCTCATATTTAPEKDRNAILAMAGEYQVTFQFQETVATAPDYQLKAPYHATATEIVEVIEDAGDRISLQHILVLNDRDTGEQRVVKHWRQDWTWQDTQILQYRGNRTWHTLTLDPEHARGQWSQAVYQVDDSPRYEALGTWTHTGDRSAWQSDPTWRPLPRREFSKRSDYHVLVATNRHTVTPSGWVHEQDNHKLVLDDNGQPLTVLAHESGLNLYNRADTLDLAAGYLYWKQTADYWSDIRDIWNDVLQQHPTLALKPAVDDQPLHASLFRLANAAREHGHSPELRQQATRTIATYIQPQP